MDSITCLLLKNVIKHDVWRGQFFTNVLMVSHCELSNIPITPDNPLLPCKDYYFTAINRTHIIDLRRLHVSSIFIAYIHKSYTMLIYYIIT